MAGTRPASSTAVEGISPEELVTRFQSGIWRYLRILGCSAAEADDLTQDTFLAVLQREFHHYNDMATRAYLRRVARNLFISVRRKAGREVASSDLEVLDRRWQEFSANDNGEQLLQGLRECLSTLSERARVALEMRFRDRSSRSEIAEALEIGEHGAKNLMQRAKQKLRQCLESRLSD